MCRWVGSRFCPLTQPPPTIDPMRLAFTKTQATGNDFVVIADPDGAIDLAPEHIRQLSDRHFGVGGDGVIRAVRSKHLELGRELLEIDPSAEWFMDYTNADGSVAEMCGNGVRAYAHFLLERGFTDFDADGMLAIGTRAGIKLVTRHELGYEVDLGRWRLAGGEPLVHADGIEVARPGLGLDLGNPHVVVALASAEELEDLELFSQPALDPVPPAGANVEFVVPLDPMVESGVGNVRMRVYERGVGETLSCGTGVAATALAVRHWAGVGAPNVWRVEVPGGVLGVRMVHGEDGEHVLLSGPASLVFDGEFDFTTG